MRVFGIDPGVATTGWGVVEDSGKIDKLTCIEHGVISTSKDNAHGDRLVELREDLRSVLEEFQPEYVGIEKLFFCKNAKTATVVGEARGVILLVTAEMKLPLMEFTPLQVKDAVSGNGKASKLQVQEMVQAILGLDELPRPDDAADGLAIAICCLHTLQNGYSTLDASKSLMKPAIVTSKQKMKRKNI
jgi:crossover junction endodeoxyribonuclease RuvC